MGDISASGLSGSLTVTTGNAADNGISITTGSAATAITGSAAGDTVTVDATQLANNTTLSLQGAAAVVVNGLSGDLSASNSSTYSETFSSGASGWTNGTVDSSNAYYGSFLGRYSNGPETSGQDRYKTFALNGQQATLTFDFLRLDSWDNENFSVYVNDVQAFSSTFQHGSAISSSSGTTNGFSWTIAPKDTLANRGFVSNWDDQAATISIAIAAGNTNVKIGIGSSLNSSMDDESYGIDNFVLDGSSLLTGPLTVTTADNTIDNGISITTGSANSTINASGSGDTITVNADAMADNTTFDINGSATYTVSNLEANTDAAGSTGSATLTYSDVTDNAASIITGSGATTITSGSSDDSFSVNADALLDNTALNLNGSATYNVTNLEGNLDVSGTSGSLSVSHSNVTDNRATLTSGSGNLTVTGGDASDTITVTGLSTNDQIFNALGASSNISVSATDNNQTITASNTGSDTINGGGGTDTLSYAGGSPVTVTASDYGSQAGSSTGQGTDSFSNIESLVGSSGTDTLQGRSSATDEVATITAANSGTLTDSASTGTFSFSSFEQLDLQGGNDTLNVTGSTGGVSLSGGVDLGSGNNTLSMSDSAGSVASLSAGSGNDSFTISAGSITGALSAGDGSNSLTISGTSASVGSYSGGTGGDTITLSGGDLGGNVDLGSGSNTLTLSSTSSTIGGNVSFGSGTSDTLSYAGYGNTVAVNLADITSNAGTTTTAGATAIGGTASGFEILVGGSTTGDSITDSSGDSTIALTGANSGTIDGLAFSSIENLNLSTGNDTVTVTGSGSGVSLSGNLNLGDGTNNLSMSGSAGSIATVNSGTGDDTMTISAGSVTGAVTAGDGSNSLTLSGTSSSIGSYTSGSGTDSLTLSGGDVVGNVSTGAGNDTVLISSTSSTIGGTLDLGGGTGDTLSYAGYSSPVSVTLTDITSNTGTTAAAGATAITGTSTGFEILIGGSNSGDSVTDSTGDSTIVISGANSGTIDGLAFSAIENLTLSTGIDGVTVQSGGSLSGTLDLGEGTSNSVQMNSGAGAIGVLTSGTGNDTVTIDGGSVTGAVTLGDGTNSLTINNTNSSIGSYSGGSGVDTIVSKGGDINGDITTTQAADSVSLSLGANVTGNVILGSPLDASDGADSLSLDASTITGNVITGSFGDVVSVLNASTITGNLTLDNPADSRGGADSLTVTGADSTNKSVVTGDIYTGAFADTVSFTNAIIGGSGKTLSLGTDSNTRDGNDSLTASSTAITATVTTGSGSDTFSLSAGSSLSGNVTLGIDGDVNNGSIDTLTLNASSITGNVATGSGADVVSVLNKSTITGNVTLGSNTDTSDGADTLTVTGADNSNKSVITGSITTTGGADVVSFSNATIGGTGQTLSLGTDSNSNDGGDSLTASGTAITAPITTGSGSDTISLSASSSISGNVTLGIDGDTNGGGSADTLTLNASSITGNVTTGSGADSVSVLNASTITGTVTLGSNSDTADGADTLTVTGASSSSPSVITGSIATGGGADVVSFSNATIGGTGQTISLGSDNNSLEGDDSLSASATTITANITTGTGSDMLTLSAGSVLTGDVSLGSVGDSTTIADPSNTILDTFDSLSGWTGGTRDSSSAYYGSFLGRYASGAKTNGQDVSKSFSLNGQPATISFDLIKLDSWDGEYFRAYINDTPAFSSTFSAGTAINGSSGTTNGFSWTIAPKDSLVGHGFAGWADQTATITIALPAGYSNIKLGFGSTLDQGIDDESYGIDNVAITSSIISNNDTLILNASSLTGNVTTGSGADSVTVINASTITGNVTLGSDSDTVDGADSLTVTGASSSNQSVINGSISTGGGADLVSFTDATIGGTGQTISLGTDNNSNDGGDSLTASNTAITAAITTGSGSDTVSLSTGSSVTGNVTLGINGDTTNGNSDTLTLDASSISGTVQLGSGVDTLTLTNESSITGDVTLGVDGDSSDGSDTVTLESGSAITGDVELGRGDDLFHLSSGISNPTSVTGDVSFGIGLGDTLSYAANAGPITVAINSDSAGTATSAYASYITGDASGFEFIIGSDDSAATSGETVATATVRDTIYDNTSASLVILTGANQGTIEDIDFSSMENLQLRAGSDILSFRGSSGSPGLIAGLADGGGIEGATYSNGVYSGGSYADASVDLLDYTQYEAGSVTVDLSQNLATGVFGDQAGGLVSGDGNIETATEDSSFENVDGSRFADAITGDNQDDQGNVLRGFGGDDTILGLAGNDTIDGGDGSSGADGADLIAAGDGADLILGSNGSDRISGGGYALEGGTFLAVEDGAVDTLSYLDENEGLDIALAGTDAGTVKADAGASISISRFTNTYSSSGAQTISVLTNQASTDWSDTYGDIQRLVLSNQNDILRIDSGDFISGSAPDSDSTFSVDAGGGALDTLDYSSFASDTPVYVNLSNAAYEFDFDANGTIDTTAGEIALENAYSATNINVDPIGISTLASASTGEGATADGGSPSGPVVVESAFGGAYGVNNFEVVIGGAADDAIVGNDANNILAGNAGADRIAGLGGADTIYGGKGDDYIIPGEDADVVNGGEGINTILITSSDLAQDTFAVDPNGINIFKLNGDGSSANTTAIAAPTGTWNPGAQGIDLLDGGDPEVSGGVTIYDTINGTTNNDDYQFGSTAFKNISDVNLGAGDDSVGTVPTSKGIKVSYDGESGSDAITLTLTFQQFARLNQSGLCVADVQNYIDAPTGQTFRSNQADFTATNFESGGVAVVTPALYNALQGDPAALTFNSSIGLQGVNTTSSGALDLIASALTSSSATAFSSADLVSAFVQANSVKGADAVVISSGTNLSGTASADHNAAASAITVDDRSDAVLSAYGLGVDRSSLSAGGDLTLNLTGRVAADTVAEAGSGVVTANGTAEAAGSRDSSLTAAGDLRTTISGTLNQSVNATTSAGLTSAGLASRTYGIDDANLTDANPDSLQAGGSLELSANATSTSEVAARSTNSQALGAITLVDNGVASTDRFTVPASLWGARFPLINGDRIRFVSTPAGSSLEANRDYFGPAEQPRSAAVQLIPAAVSG